MNIKDTITELGLDVENLPRILKQRVETVEDLVSKVALAEKRWQMSQQKKVKLN